MTTTTCRPARRGPVDLTARWFLRRRSAWPLALGHRRHGRRDRDRGLRDRRRAVDASVVQYGTQVAIWFPFSVFIGLTLAYLPVHVASGLTRQALSRGSLLAAVGTAARLRWRVRCPAARREGRVLGLRVALGGRRRRSPASRRRSGSSLHTSPRSWSPTSPDSWRAWPTSGRAAGRARSGCPSRSARSSP